MLICGAHELIQEVREILHVAKPESCEGLLQPDIQQT